MGAACWYCHWGWAKPVADVYREAVKRLGGCEHDLHFGPSHIVWEDENWDRGSIEFCLADCDREWPDITPDDLAIVRWSLLELLKIPDEIRECEPAGYEGVNPGDFPPIGVETEVVAWNAGG